MKFNDRKAALNSAEIKPPQKNPEQSKAHKRDKILRPEKITYIIVNIGERLHPL